MIINVLHINRNFIFNKLHQALIDSMDQEVCLNNTVFAPSSKEQDVNYKVGENVIVSKCFSLKDKYFYALKQIKIYRSLKAHLQISYQDIIHAYTLFTDGGCAYKIKKKFGKPFVVAIRNTDINDFFRKMPFLRNYGKRILKEAEAIFFLSQPYMDTLVNTYLNESEKKLLCKKMHVIPNGVDGFWIDNSLQRKNCDLNRIANYLRIIYVGRIDENKNIESTAKAIELLIQEGVSISFTVIGKIENKEIYERLKRYSFFIYKSEMTKEELIKEYRKHDVFVMPSFTETFGVTYVEAMSQGLPIIYSENQGFDKQFEEGIVGYHVNPYDIKDIAKKIRAIMSDYQRISNNCTSHCHEYNWVNISNRYCRIYKEIVEKVNKNGFD